jgi:hypothetical protein
MTTANIPFIAFSSSFLPVAEEIVIQFLQGRGFRVKVF